MANGGIGLCLEKCETPDDIFFNGQIRVPLENFSFIGKYSYHSYVDLRPVVVEYSRRWYVFGGRSILGSDKNTGCVFCHKWLGSKLRIRRLSEDLVLGKQSEEEKQTREGLRHGAFHRRRGQEVSDWKILDLQKYDDPRRNFPERRRSSTRSPVKASKQFPSHFMIDCLQLESSLSEHSACSLDL
mmetsp:Transcript_26082/g.60571  ORF Transcript_26082/g.60571 Transcript_26082/m.60571 type:complete len:185 (-) Transcript_26082:195-749(-)